MKKEIIKVELKNGLEATPAAMLVQVASTYDSKIYLQSEDGMVKVNAKSIMGMMSLGFGNGDALEIEANGPDEEVAVEEMKNYIESVK